MRRKRWLFVLTMWVALAVVGSAVVAGINGGTAMWSPVVVGNTVTAGVNEDFLYPPTYAGTLTWTWNCTDCPNVVKPWVAGTCVSFLKDFQINVKADYSIPIFGGG